MKGKRLVIKPIHAFLAVSSAVLFCVVFFGYITYRDYQNHKTWTYTHYPNPLRGLDMGDGMPGPNGEPPATVRELIPPIKIVEAHFYWDGGTCGVHLRDSVGTNVWISYPSPPEFENYPAGFRYNTLYVGSSNCDAPSARLPVSKPEAYMLCRSLRLALNDVRDEFDAMQADGHPEKYSQRNNDLSVAFGLLEKLEKCKRFHLENDLRSLESRIKQARAEN